MKIGNLKFKIDRRGFSLVEVVFAAAVFIIVAMAVFQGFFTINKLVAASRDKITATDLMNSEFELVRNLSFANVGLMTGIPHGILAATTTKTVDQKQFEITRVIRNIDDPFDGKIGQIPNDLSPADYKLVEIRIVCINCKNELDFSASAYIAPKNLETASTNGALFITVYDANGNPVPQADITISNPAKGISITETTDNDGLFALVDAPPSSNSYRIIATKTGYTTHRTYATSTGNPNPTKLDATVLLQQVTPISFIIDRVSSINIRSINNFCAQVPSVSFTVDGTKLIGTSPNVFKWNGSFTTDSSGIKNLTNIEWDTFTFKTTGSYLAGTNPISPISILPNSNQNVDLIMSSESPSFLLVNVKDSSSGLPISDASVRLYAGAYNKTLVTDQGFVKQTDWSGGAGQLNFSDSARYHSDDTNIAINSPAGELKLVNSLGNYVASGNITSSVFDTGTSSNWSRVDIEPHDQPPQAGANSVRFQIATSPTNTGTETWNFLGPDATASTYYTITNNTLNAIHDGDRYIRYKLFLNTENPSFTPNISDFAISFSSSCTPPGQVLFYNLSNQTYTLEVSAIGYDTQTIGNISVSSDWQSRDVLLSP